MRRTGFILAGFAVLLSACTEGQLAVPSSEEQGGVVIMLSSDESTNAVPSMKAGGGDASSETDLPDIDDFEVEIYSLSSGWRLYRDTYANTVGKTIALNAGEYRLLAQHGDSLGIGFNSIWYAADTQFTVHGQTTEEISAVAKMSKVKVAIEYGPNLMQKYSQYHSRVRLDGSSSRYLRFEKDETRAGYLPAGSLGYEFYVNVEGDWMYYPAAPVECSPNDFITFHVELDLGSGSLKVVTVRVDDSMEEVLNEETIPAEAAPKDPPAITLSGFDDNNSYSFIEADGAALAQADIVAKGGIKSCVLGIESEYLSALGVPASVDLTASESLDDAVVEALRSVGMRWPRSMEGVRFANVDFTSSADVLKYDKEASVPFSGTFTLTVTDELDRQAAATFTVTNNEPETPAFAPAEGNAFAKRFKGFTASITKGNPAAIGIQYSTDGTDWTTVYPESVSDGTATFADITGLAPETQYQVRAIYNENEDYATVPVTLTTEAAAQVGNAGFEEWHSVRLYHQSVLWATNDIYGYYFWPESALEESRWWDTSNGTTTPDPGSSSVWDYRSASGVVPTADEGNTASYHLRTHDGQSSLTTEGHNGNAVEIATVGWGTGNSWISESSTPSNRTAGCLVMGTYGSENYGKDFSSRPTSVTFWYKYHSYNGETTTPYVELFDVDNNRVGYGSMQITDSAYSYVQARIDIGYTSLSKAVRMTVVFPSTDSSSPSTKAVQGSYSAFAGYLDSRHIGSILTVDDVELIYE